MANLRYPAIVARLAAEIADGKWKVGGRFPTEEQLQRRFKAGRHSVREAIAALAAQGLIGRRPRIGATVLAREPVSPNAANVADLADSLGLAGTATSIEQEGFVTLSLAALQEMGVEAEAARPPVSRRWRRLAGLRRDRHGAPLCWCEIFLPERFALDRADLGDGRPVFEACLRSFDLRLEFVEQQASASTVPVSIAARLEAAAGLPALLIRRRYVAHTGATFEVAHSLYPVGRHVLRSVIRQK